jgi:hypothetical protein
MDLEYDNYKGVIKKMREKVGDILAGSLNIDKLMKDKVEDYILLEEQPMPIGIGERTIFVGNLTYNNEHLFFNKWAKLISLLGAKIVNMELAEERRKELLERASFNLLAEGKWMYEFLTMDKWLFKKLSKLIGKTILKQQAFYLNEDKMRKKLKWKNCSLRYFKKYITKEKIIQMCFLIYFYNFDSVKKNIQVLVEKMCMKSLAERYRYSWLANLGGATGKYLTAQAPSIESVWKDDFSKPVPKNHGPRKKLTSLEMSNNIEKHTGVKQDGKPNRSKTPVG